MTRRDRNVVSALRSILRYASKARQPEAIHPLRCVADFRRQMPRVVALGGMLSSIADIVGRAHDHYDGGGLPPQRGRREHVIDRERMNSYSAPLNTCPHSARIEHALGVEALFHPLAQGGKSRLLRLEHINGSAHRSGSPHQR